MKKPDEYTPKQHRAFAAHMLRPVARQLLEEMSKALHGDMGPETCAALALQFGYVEEAIKDQNPAHALPGMVSAARAMGAEQFRADEAQMKANKG